MSLTVNLYYHGQNGSARKFAEEMEASGVAQAIREEDGNLRYEYFQPLADPETIDRQLGKPGGAGRPPRFADDGPAG
ncbi:hypothetical protein ME789_02690 [Lactobacillus delbrueckii]|nr:hypothetical protein ME789_02690 [Lactobacillus delbrueckii]